MVALPLLAGTAVISLIRTTAPPPWVEVPGVLGPGAQAEVTDTGCRPYFQDPTGQSGGCAGGEERAEPLTAASVEQVLGVDEVVPRWNVEANLVTAGLAVDDQRVAEVERADVLAEVAAAVAGRLPERPGEAALVPGLARRLDVVIGDTVTLQHQGESVDLEIVGLLDPRRRSAAALLSGSVPLEWRLDDPAWLVLGSEPVGWDQVLAANEQGWQVWSRAVMLDPPPLDETPYGQSFTGVSGVSLQMAGLVGAVLAMGRLEIGLLIGPAFAIGAKRNSRQLALTAAAGGSPSDLRRMVLATGMVAGTAAAVIGIGLGIVLLLIGTAIANRVMDSGYLTLVLPSWELAALAVAGLLLGVGAAWLPARSAARRDVVASLAGRRDDPRIAHSVGRLSSMPWRSGRTGPHTCGCGSAVRNRARCRSRRSAARGSSRATRSSSRLQSRGNWVWSRS